MTVVTSDFLASILPKRCCRCRNLLPRFDFYNSARASDGKMPFCKECDYARTRDRLKARVRHERFRYVPVKRAARAAVQRAMAAGTLPRARTLRCTDCPAPAQQYDHWLGYERAHWLHVQPVCTRCHGRRSRARGEHARQPVAA